jgi:hypothetical protein
MNPCKFRIIQWFQAARPSILNYFMLPFREVCVAWKKWDDFGDEFLIGLQTNRVGAWTGRINIYKPNLLKNL